MKQCYVCKNENVIAEHFISNSVLDLIQIDRKIFVAGSAKFPSKSVGVGSYKSHVLCDSCSGTTLSNLDTEAKKLFSGIINNVDTKVDGALIERWLVKVFLGAYSSGHLGQAYVISPSVLRRWVNILIDKKQLQYPNGFWQDLWVAIPAKNIKNLCGLWPIIDNDILIGINLIIFNNRFTLIIDEYGKYTHNIINNHYRPGLMIFDVWSALEYSKSKFEIELFWPDNQSHGAIRTTIINNTDEPVFK